MCSNKWNRINSRMISCGFVYHGTMTIDRDKAMRRYLGIRYPSQINDALRPLDPPLSMQIMNMPSGRNVVATSTFVSYTGKSCIFVAENGPLPQVLKCNFVCLLHGFNQDYVGLRDHTVCHHD